MMPLQLKDASTESRSGGLGPEHPLHLLFLALDVDLGTQRGEAIHTRELARFLAARGIRVDLVTATPLGAVPHLGAGVFHHTRPSSSDWAQVRLCTRLAREGESHAIYERRLSPKIAFAVSRLVGIPFLVEVNGVEEEAAILGRTTRPVRRALTFPLRRRIYHAAATVIAVSDPLAALVRDLHGLPQGRVVPIPNGVDTDRFTPLEPAEARARLGLPAGLWILFVGNLVPWQGVETLLEAFRRVSMSVPEARLAIVGDGPLRGPLEGLARELQIANRVYFPGTVPHEDVPRFIGASDVCAAPFTQMRNARIGLSPLKLYEYLACGRPIVASDVPGVRELLDGSGAGILVRPDDPGALTKALVSILNDPLRARSMGVRGRGFAFDSCSWARTAERLEGLLRAAVRTVRKGGRAS